MVWAAVLLILAHWWERMARTIAVAVMAWQTDGERAWWRPMASEKGLGNKMLNKNCGIGKGCMMDRQNGFMEMGWMAFAMAVAAMALDGDCNCDWWMATNNSTDRLNCSTVTSTAHLWQNIVGQIDGMALGRWVGWLMRQWLQRWLLREIAFATDGRGQTAQ